MRRFDIVLVLTTAGLFHGTGCLLDMGGASSDELALEASAEAASCGDGDRATDEACDDGNNVDGDGCSSACTVEHGYACTDADFSLDFTEQWGSDDAPDPSWSLSADGLTVQQGTNSSPAVYMTNLPASGTTISFDLKVATLGDDDFIGWVVGFDAGDTTSPDAEFMLFDWKRGDQTLGSGELGLAGLAMSRVQGLVQSSGGNALGPFFEHGSGITEEARAINLGRQGWGPYVTHRIIMSYDVSRIRVWVDGVLEFDETGSFPSGKFGFYTCSQAAGNFTLVSPTTGSVCGLDPDADPDGDGVRTGDDPAPFDPTICGDADGDGVDDCQAGCDREGELGDWHYCSEECPCDDGEGDCDNDAECAAGTICVKGGIGAEFGFDPDVDMCLATCHRSPLGGSKYCGPDCPCDEGEGDCDSDDECAPGLRCIKNVGADYGFEADADVCVATCHPSVVGGFDYCSPECPCDEGEGDCDSDDDCAAGLTCAHDAGASYGFDPEADVCEAVN